MNYEAQNNPDAASVPQEVVESGEPISTEAPAGVEKPNYKMRFLETTRTSMKICLDTGVFGSYTPEEGLLIETIVARVKKKLPAYITSSTDIKIDDLDFINVTPKDDLQFDQPTVDLISAKFNSILEDQLSKW